MPETPKPKVLREYKMFFKKVPQGKKAVPNPDKLGLRSKLGGEPDWEQRPVVVKCRECKKPMTFIAQIDSMEHESDDNPLSCEYLPPDLHYMFVDVGMLYVFFCFDCFETKSICEFG